MATQRVKTPKQLNPNKTTPKVIYPAIFRKDGGIFDDYSDQQIMELYGWLESEPMALQYIKKRIAAYFKRNKSKVMAEQAQLERRLEAVKKMFTM